MVAVPSAMAVTSPAVDIVATPVSDDDQVIVGFGIVLPLLSVTVGTRVAVSPTEEKFRLSGESEIEPAAWPTVTDAVALTEPELAVIVVEPSATALTNPDDETVATVESPVAQATVASTTSVPAASLTVPVILVVSPSAENVSVESDNTMLAAA